MEVSVTKNSLNKLWPLPKYFEWADDGGPILTDITTIIEYINTATRIVISNAKRKIKR